MVLGNQKKSIMEDKSCMMELQGQNTMETKIQESFNKCNSMLVQYRIVKT